MIELIFDLIHFLFQFVYFCLFGFTQMLVTAMWKTDDATIIAKRNACLALYGSGLILAVVSIGFTWFGIMNLLGMFFCCMVSVLLLVIAGSLANEVEKLVLQQKTPDQKDRGF